VLTEHIVELASQHGRYGYRRITALLRNQVWKVNHKHVERIWRKEGLKVPAGNLNAPGSDRTMAHACGFVHCTRTMCGATISSRSERIMAGHSGS
jgi:hypothetical protein